MGKGKTKKRGGKKDEMPIKATEPKKVAFTYVEESSNHKVGGLRPSPSINTLSLLDREKVVLWRRPFTTLYYSFAELICLSSEFLLGLLQYRILLTFLSLLTAVASYFYMSPGPHQAYLVSIEAKLIWWSWWVFLGILSSIGLGSGLHTFLLYLGPHIAAVTLAAYECSSLDFPEPPYPQSIICPSTKSAAAITLWNIVAKIRVESFLWGVGTAIGELPPYFMARAARLSGIEPEDEEYKEFLELKKLQEGGGSGQKMSIVDSLKLRVEAIATKAGFWGILACASIPNPFFDLAGITCGHFLVPFWTFFGATVIGKAIVKMHVQMLFVVVVFSEHHIDKLLSLIASLPHGDSLRGPIRDFFSQQKKALHRKDGSPVEQRSNVLSQVMGAVVSVMVLYFLISLINGLAQSYHKRLFDRTKKKAV